MTKLSHLSLLQPVNIADADIERTASSRHVQHDDDNDDNDDETIVCQVFFFSFRSNEIYFNSHYHTSFNSHSIQTAAVEIAGENRTEDILCQRAHVLAMAQHSAVVGSGQFGVYCLRFCSVSSMFCGNVFVFFVLKKI